MPCASVALRSLVRGGFHVHTKMKSWRGILSCVSFETKNRRDLVCHSKQKIEGNGRGNAKSNHNRPG